LYFLPYLMMHVRIRCPAAAIPQMPCAEYGSSFLPIPLFLFKIPLAVIADGVYLAVINCAKSSIRRDASIHGND